MKPFFDYVIVSLKRSFLLLTQIDLDFIKAFTSQSKHSR